MKNKILYSLNQGQEALNQLKEPSALAFIEKSAHLLSHCFKMGSKVILAGNGGSLCDATHFAEELTGVFRVLRAALPAIVLSEPGHLTCVANDLGYEKIFSRGVEAFGQPGDIFIGLTTSGRSPNIISAFKKAKEKQLITLAFLGKDGGELKGFADEELIISGFTTSDRIQEAHMLAMHIIIEMIEELLFNTHELNSATLSEASSPAEYAAF